MRCGSCAGPSCLRDCCRSFFGSAIGIPGGLALLQGVPPAHLKIGVGVLLILFSVYNLARPKLPAMQRVGRVGDAGIGFLNGVLGGILPTIWSGLRGWTREEQRAVFQPTAVATFLMCLVAFGGVGLVTPEALRLFLLGLPALVAGTLLGWALYGKLDDASFRKVVLALLLLSGVTLLAMQR